MILVDTNIWSLALRRRAEQLSVAETKIVARWSRLAVEGEVALICPIRQEILSGIRHREQFLRLQARLDDFPCFGITVRNHDKAAECFNACRVHGISAESIDMIICAAAIVHNVPIMTIDPDFVRYAKHLPIHVESPS